MKTYRSKKLYGGRFRTDEEFLRFCEWLTMEELFEFIPDDTLDELWEQFDKGE